MEKKQHVQCVLLFFYFKSVLHQLVFVVVVTNFSLTFVAQNVAVLESCTCVGVHHKQQQKKRAVKNSCQVATRISYFSFPFTLFIRVHLYRLSSKESARALRHFVFTNFYYMYCCCLFASELVRETTTILLFFVPRTYTHNTRTNHFSLTHTQTDTQTCKMRIVSKLHAYTAWANMRMSPMRQQHPLSFTNVAVDLFKSRNFKYLLQSFTGHSDDRFQAFEKYISLRVTIFCRCR